MTGRAQESRDTIKKVYDAKRKEHTPSTCPASGLLRGAAV